MGKVAYEIKTIKDLVTRAASKYQNRIAYRYMRKKELIEKSYEQVKKDCDAFGRTLSKLGMIGKHIAIIGPTSYEYLIAY
ncbi:MAG: long-chain fatty acid--CoA ligase, partial [Cellulosilyticum sp.]|nr:long-chain fatty acid--CoA ligase [Cellulosilyticum sp.]